MDKILIIAAGSIDFVSLTGRLGSRCLEYDTVSGGSEALGKLVDHRYGVLVTGLVLPDMQALDLLESVRHQHPSLSVLVIGTDRSEQISSALRNGASAFIRAPFDPEEVLLALERLIAERRIQRENDELKGMLNLLKASQSIVGCLETERVYHLVQDAVSKEIGVSRSMGLFQSEQALEILHLRGIGSELAAYFKGMIQPEITRSLAENAWLVRIEDLPDAPAAVKIAGIDSICLVLLMNHTGLLQGAILYFNDPGQPFPDITSKKQNILFLMEQALRALENARNYSLAKDMLFIDDLSGLYNYRYLEIALDRELKRIERYSSQLAVLFLDLDSFKQVNDTHGHLVGSRVLREVGILLKSSVRDVDVVIRYGGDEYTIILVETNPEAAGSVAERVRRLIADHSFLEEEGLHIRLTCSIGYSCCPEDTLSKNDLLDMADTAMYAGKGSGKNCVVRFHTSS